MHRAMRNFTPRRNLTALMAVWGRAEKHAEREFHPPEAA